MSSPPKKGLGRGLGALISMSERTMQTANQTGVMDLELTQIEPNLQQPRRHFDEDALADLSQSIKNFGIIQPLVVKQAENGYYVIVAGERRWRAARLAGLTHVPAIVKDYTDAEVLQVALIENVQREDLNPIEEAMCYRRLADELLLTQEDIAQDLETDRANISRSLRKLEAKGIIKQPKKRQYYIDRKYYRYTVDRHAADYYKNWDKDSSLPDEEQQEASAESAE